MRDIDINFNVQIRYAHIIRVQITLAFKNSFQKFSTMVHFR